MKDQRNIAKEVFLKIAGSPMVVGPFMLGVSAITATWALGLKGLALAAGLLAGAIGLLGAVGALATRWILGRDRMVADLTEEMRREQRQARRESLDQLERRLERDGDPRTEGALRDLRALREAFREMEKAGGESTRVMLVDIGWRSEQLFDQCLRSLEKSLELWQTAGKLASEAARNPVLERREQIVTEVQNTVRHLSATLASMQGAGLGSHEGERLARLREELDQSLEVAKRVEKRMDSLFDGGATDLPELNKNLSRRDT